MGSADMVKSAPICCMCFDGQSTSRVIRPVPDAESAQICGPTWGAHVAPACSLVRSLPGLNASHR